MSDPYGFRGGVTGYGAALLTDRVETNVQEWLRWSLLGVGAYETVAPPDPRATLTPSPDARYPAGTRWRASRGDWVWEDPALRPAGVTVDGVFSGPTGARPHAVDYRDGQVIFAAAVPLTAAVTLTYSPRLVSVYRADVPWFQSLLAGGYDPAGPGLSVAPEARVAFPALVVEPTLNTSSTPWELGNAAKNYVVPLLVHVLADAPGGRKRLVDALCKQKDARLFTYDPALADPPLDPSGRLAPGGLTYPEQCRARPWLGVAVLDCRPTGSSRVGQSLWLATVRLDCSVVGP